MLLSAPIALSSMLSCRCVCNRPFNILIGAWISTESVGRIISIFCSAERIDIEYFWFGSRLYKKVWVLILIRCSSGTCSWLLSLTLWGMSLIRVLWILSVILSEYRILFVLERFVLSRRLITYHVSPWFCSAVEVQRWVSEFPNWGSELR